MTGEVSVLSRRRRRAEHWWRRPALPVLRDPSTALFYLLVVASLALGVSMLVWPNAVPPMVFAIPIVLAGLFLGVRELVAAYVLMVAWIAAGVLHTRTTLLRDGMAVLTAVALMAMMFLVARSRARLGTTGLRGDSMFVDLRDRIASSGALPPLPEGWTVDNAIRSANGDGFSGDFLVSSLSTDGHRLEVALVDVSGKGREAGTRSLLLSGAFSGIIGSLPPGEFLPAVNSYLLRQKWDEGFATAVHISVDLRTGEYSVGRAGHPAPAQYLVGSGSWRLVGGGRGPLLGVMDGMDYPRVTGRLAHGDALLLYSDGVIESRGHDLDEGVDRMLGVASRVMVQGGRGLADQVCKVARAGLDDDRAAFALLRR